MHRALRDLVDLAERGDRDDQALGPVEVDDRLGLAVVDLEALADRVLGVVTALVQLAAADVADTLGLRRVVGDVEDVGGVGAADAPAA